MKKVILIIRDGWGYRKSTKFNALAEAKTPIDDKISKEYPTVIIDASQEAVGLPKNYQGNSEVGHLTIGSGRIIEQSLIRIDKSIKDGSFFRKEEFLKAIDNCEKHNSKLHIIGLLQKEGVHSHINHLFAILELAAQRKFKDVVIHVITDGRDSPVDRGRTYLKELIKKMQELNLGEIATINGRYFAMDRDKRWQRTQKAYEAIVMAQSKERFQDPLDKLNQFYKRKITDEFVVPAVKDGYQGIKENDSVIFYNLRTDRPRQLTQAIAEKEFNEWPRKFIKTFFVAMTDYYKPMNAHVVFKEKKIKNILGEVLSRNKKKQLRLSETEKYPHVTFFFNGQQEDAFNGEERIMVASPKVDTYDQKPEMSIDQVVKIAQREIAKDKHDLVVINLVNADMVGHSGKRKAIIEAVEAVDKATGKIIEEGLKKDYSIIVFADHGNAEDQRKEWRTSHTINPVPLTLITSQKDLKLKKNKGLQDIAPTVLDIMGIEKPEEMQGESIIK